MTKIDIQKIDYSILYEGYYWYSDATKPTIIDNQTINIDIFKKLPFIIEGNLYAKKENISINIKCIDGEYKVFIFDLNNLPNDQYSEEHYLAHDIKGVSKIKMIQYWEESEPDSLLEDMQTLIPSWQAFKGFII